VIPVNWAYLAASFGGGVFGAAFGALPAFVLCGLAVIVGTVIALITGDQSFNTIVTWGPFLGPHVSFAGGVAAAAFAAKKGLLDSGRNIVTPLLRLNSTSVLLVGGLFGVLGSIFAGLLAWIPEKNGVLWVNPIAFSVTLNVFIVRLMFGRTGLLGRVRKRDRRWHPSNEQDSLPWHIRPLPLIILSAGISLPTAFVAVSLPGSTGLVFGLTAAALVLLVFGVKIPVVIHTVLSVEFIAAATGNIWWGVTFGILAAFLAEGFACLFLIHGDTHIDPPAISLALVYSLYPLLSLIGLFLLSGLWPMLCAGLTAAVSWAVLARLRA